MSSRLQLFRHTSASIDLQALEHNVRVLRQAIGVDNFFCPMVKANAYGHGDVEIALQLERLGVSAMGVGLIEEGQLLRQMGIRSPLLVFGIFDAAGAVEIIRNGMTPVIGTWEQLQTLAQQLKLLAAPLPFAIHLKFDTGMHRLGFDWLAANKVLQYCQSHRDIFKVAGIATHLHSAEDAGSERGKSFQQLQRFAEVESVFASLQPVSHTLNSAGLLNFVKMRQAGVALPGISIRQGVRPGLAVYGYTPLPEVSLDLRPVMSLRSHIVRLHQVGIGEGVSYGHTWLASRRSVIGVVPIGYADGYHRALSNRGEVLLQGHRVPVVGNICMDYLMLDLTDTVAQFPNLPLHEAEVTLFGADSTGKVLSVPEVATKAQTIPWEILTSISERVPRVYLGQSSRQVYARS